MVGGDWGRGGWGGFVCQDEGWGRLPAVLQVDGGKGGRAVRGLGLEMHKDSFHVQARGSWSGVGTAAAGVVQGGGRLWARWVVECGGGQWTMSPPAAMMAG